MKRLALLFFALVAIFVVLHSPASSGTLQAAPSLTPTQVIYMMGQSTANCLVQIANQGINHPTGGACASPDVEPAVSIAQRAVSILKNSTVVVILTHEDPPYPATLSNVCGAAPYGCSTWSHLTVVDRFSAFDRYTGASPGPAGSPCALPTGAPTPVTTPTPGTNDTGLCPAIIGAESAGTPPPYMCAVMMDNELETSQTTPVWETNAPAFYYGPAAAAVHNTSCNSGPRTFWTTGGLHPTYPCYLKGGATSGYDQTYYTSQSACPSTDVAVPGWAPYPCEALHGVPYPCQSYWTNDLWATVGGTPPLGTQSNTMASDGGNWQSQTALGCCAADLQTFLNVIWGDISNATPNVVTPTAFQMSAGTGTLGNCDGCAPGVKGLLTQTEMDLGAENIGTYSLYQQMYVWVNVGPHKGPSCTGTGCPIPGRDDMVAQEIINLQNFTPPNPQPTPSGATPIPSPSTTLPPFGVFNSCEIDEGSSACIATDATIYSTGITYEVNYLAMVAHLTGSNSLAAVLTANDTGGSSGGVGVRTYINIKNIMTDTNIATQNNLIQFTYGSGACGTNTSCMAQDCGVSTDEALLQCVDTMAKTHPSFAGYYIADEPGTPSNPSSGLPPAGNFGMVNQVAAYLKSIDPTASILVLNTGGGNTTLSATAPYFSCNGQAPCASPTAPVTPFPWISDSYTPNTGFDFFPIAAPSGGMPNAYATAPPGTLVSGQYISQSDQTWPFLYSIFRTNYPPETASFVGQSFSWYQESGSGCSTYSNCLYPTQTQQQLQRDHALYYANANGVPIKIFWWFSWTDISCGHTYTGCNATTNETQLAAVDSEAFPLTPPPTPTPTPTPPPGVTLAQSETCGYGSSCALSSNPTTGQTISVIALDVGNSLASVVAKDSAGNVLTQQTVSSGCSGAAKCAAIYDEVAPSGITGTINFTLSGSPYDIDESAVLELQGQSGTNYYGENSTGSNPSTLAATISEVQNLDFLECGYIQAGTSSGNLTFTFTNSGTLSYLAQTTGYEMAYAGATSAASTTFTAGNLSTGFEAGLACADYQ